MFGVSIVSLVFLFLIRLRFPRGKSIADVIVSRYGRRTLQLYRRVEKADFKSKKLTLDLRFLNNCNDFGVIPNFLRFRVYSHAFQHTRTYKSWMLKLLDYEIQSQRKKSDDTTTNLSVSLAKLRETVSFFDFKCLYVLLTSSNDRKIDLVRKTHDRKLKNLGVNTDLRVDYDKVIFNLSDRNLSKQEKEVLGLGLDFGLKPDKINTVTFFRHFENLCHIVKDCKIYDKFQMNNVMNRLSVVANNSYRNFRSFVNNNKAFNTEKLEVLKGLKDSEDLVITRPDKGKGVVLLNTNEYIDKINGILADRSKFRLIKAELATQILKLEDKLNRLLRKIKDNIGTNIYNKLFASGSRPGYLYGLPKVHKVSNLLRPIISSICTFNYNLAKFLANLISPVTSNEYSINNSASFVEELRSLNFDRPIIMASFDVESLFTNVPLQETTNIIVDGMSDEKLEQAGLNKTVFSDMLKIATSDSIFTFQNQLFSQIDGVAMGSPLSCCYANVFLCYWEQIWLDNCPLEYKPLYYRRYVDDTFLVFRELSHVQRFLDYLNSQHQNIRFTSEIESDSKLPFLDVIVCNIDNGFTTSVYRKPTFTGLGLNFLSFTPLLYKTNCIRTLINRAYEICSNYFTLDKEIQFLRKYFTNNCFPTHVFDNIMNSFLNKKLIPSVPTLTVPRDLKYIKLPYMGRLSFDVKRELRKILRDAFPQIQFKFVFTNSVTIGSYLKKRNSLPAALCSCVVYEFKCPSCGARYLGSTNRWLSHRIQEHRGVSIRTGLPLSRPSASAIRDHSHEHDHLFTHSDFKVITKVSNRLDLSISESLYIHKFKPELNYGLVPIQLYTQ